MRRHDLSVFLAVGLVVVALLAASVTAAHARGTIERWQIQSSSLVTSSGAIISTNGYDASKWYVCEHEATTVFGCLTDLHVYENPLHGKNLQEILPEPFYVPWWYRGCFDPTTATTLLTFKGINYKANVWANGELIGTSDEVVGAFRYFDFVVNTTEALAAFHSRGSTCNGGGGMTVALEIMRPINYAFPPNNNDTDLSMTFIDWAPPPPDSSMGVWQVAQVTPLGATMQVTARYPVVATTLEVGFQGTYTATLSVSVEVSNWDNNTFVEFLVRAEVSLPKAGSKNGASVEGSFSLKPGATSLVTLRDIQVPVTGEDLWWPWQMGPPTMHDLTLSVFSADGTQLVFGPTVSKYGVRQVSSEVDANGHRLFSVNYKPILIRGGGWAPDLFMAATASKHTTTMQLTRDMGLNTIRLEGLMPPDDFFDAADAYGLLVMPGWSCCDAWQHWYSWNSSIADVAVASLHTQLKRLRIHPSVFVFFYGSDEQPPEWVESQYLATFAAELWPNPTVASAAATTSPLSGPTGVKMSGPYAWVPPVYWSQGARLGLVGGAFGFLTEGGVGAAPLTADSWVRSVSAEEEWPLHNGMWAYHCANPGGFFHDLDTFSPQLEARYGSQSTKSTMEAFTSWSQVAAYEGHRAELEGYSGAKYNATGIIHWMLNNAWPSNMWHLIDYYNQQGGSYFGAKKACAEPVHVQLNYDTMGIYVVNNRYVDSPPNMILNVTVLAVPGGHLILSNQSVVDGVVEGDAVVQVASLGGLDCGGLCFIHLELSLGWEGSSLSDNVYWINTKSLDVLNWTDSTYWVTYTTHLADLSALASLDESNLVVDVTLYKYINESTTSIEKSTTWSGYVSTTTSATSGNHLGDDPYVFHVTLDNHHEKGVAFFVHINAWVSLEGGLMEGEEEAEEEEEGKGKGAKERATYSSGPSSTGKVRGQTPLTPITLSDNFITVFPKRQRFVVVTVPRSSVAHIKSSFSIIIEVSGINVPMTRYVFPIEN